MKKVVLLFALFVSMSMVYAQTECPLGLENDPYPGQCGSYTDENQNKYCDLSEVGEDHNCEESITGVVNQDGISIQIEGEQLKTMTIEQVANDFDVSLSGLLGLIANEINIEVKPSDLLGDLHDAYQLRTKTVKDFVAQLTITEPVIQTNIQQVKQRSYITDLLGAANGMQREYFLIIIGVLIVLSFLPIRKTILQIVGYYVLPVLAIGWAGRVGYKASAMHEVYETGRILGYISLWLFFVIMITKPICILLLGKQNIILKTIGKFTQFIVSVRRELGVLIFWGAGAHFINYFVRWILLDKGLFEFFDIWTSLIGLISFVALLLGGITSNNYSVSKLGIWRKRIQMIAYPALILAVVHIFIINPLRGTILFGLLGIYIILKFFEIKKIGRRR